MKSRRDNRRHFSRRPPWRDYLFAYVLIGVGFALTDVSAVPPHSSVPHIIGAVLFFAGLLIFIAAVGHSIWFVLGGKPPRDGAR